MPKTVRLSIDRDACSEVYNIGSGVFHPLKGFMDSADYKSVIDDMRLDNGSPWTIPVTLEVPEEKAGGFIRTDSVILTDAERGVDIAQLRVEDVYKVNFKTDLQKVFGTGDPAHPGVAKELSRSPYRVGGAIKILHKEDDIFRKHSILPQEAKNRFRQNGWKTIVGFQTRNPIHRAHEYLQRIGMEIADGIFIHPLAGWKKADDFSPEAIVKSYEKMIDCFYDKTRVVFSLLKTPMRYAGPREAVFHAIIRRNFGCTHFIIGRDHAGVGNYYGKYDAHDFVNRFDDLGIEILRLYGPYYCKKCKGIVTEKTCPHGEAYEVSISGTKMRSLFSSGRKPPETYMRKEISQVLMELGKNGNLFCGGRI